LKRINVHQASTRSALWHSCLPFRTIPREHWLIWWEYVQGAPKLTIKKLRPA